MKPDHRNKQRDHAPHQTEKTELREVPEGSHWIDFATKEHKNLVHYELNMYGNHDQAWQEVVVKGNNNIFSYRKDDFWSIHILPRDCKDRFKKLMGNPGLKHFGLFLGLFKGDLFNLSIEGADAIARSGIQLRNWIKTTDAGERSFLYGNDLKGEDIASVHKGGIAHDRGICLVLNEGDECIGLGKLQARDPTLSSCSDKEVVIRNIIDKGIYLRNQDKI